MEQQQQQNSSLKKLQIENINLKKQIKGLEKEIKYLKQFIGGN